MFTVKTKPKTINLWKCPKCGLQFEKKHQSHSCKLFPLEQHFKNKDKGKLLYEKFELAIRREFGSLKIESLECCIHFVSTFTFVAIKILKNKIRVDFTLTHEIKNDRIKLVSHFSLNRYLYYIDILAEDEINTELIEWIKEAHDYEII
jgi:hypothetical protein